MKKIKIFNVQFHEAGESNVSHLQFLCDDIMEICKYLANNFDTGLSTSINVLENKSVIVNYEWMSFAFFATDLNDKRIDCIKL